MDSNRQRAADGPDQHAGWVLAIDFGTSFSSAALAADDGIDLVDIHGDRRVPSMVLLAEDGHLLVGMLAANQAAAAPDRLERTPKALVGRSPVLLLGGRPVTVVDAVGALVTAFVDEARRRRGGTEPAAVTLTHPVRWGAERKRVLREAALSAGVDPSLVEEPVAAASAFRSDRVLPGSLVAVYDLGGGTFDAAVLEATETGFVVAGPPGGDDNLGGEAFDERLLAHVGETVAGTDPAGWEALAASDERRWRRAHAQLRDHVRLAKETLSVAQQASVYVPGVDTEVLVTRAEFERLIAGDVARTLEILDDVINAAGTTPDALTAVYPVGGSSRIPLVAHELLERYGDRVITWDDPQAAVALGAARMARHRLKLLDERPAPAATKPAPVAPPPPPPQPEAAPRPPQPEAAPPPPAEPVAEPEPEGPSEPPRRGRRRAVAGAMTALLLVLVGIVVVGVVQGGGAEHERASQGPPETPETCPIADANDLAGTVDRDCFAKWFAGFHENVPPIHGTGDVSDQYSDTDRATESFLEHFNQAFGTKVPYEPQPCGNAEACIAHRCYSGTHKAAMLNRVGMVLLVANEHDEFSVIDVQIDREILKTPDTWSAGDGLGTLSFDTVRDVDDPLCSKGTVDDLRDLLG